MIIDGYNIYCGAYAERQMNEQKMISVEMNNLRGVSQQIKTESGTNICSKSVEVSISQDNINFLCSEEGLLKIQSDTENLYIMNEKMQKEIANGKDESDLFWGNTSNQWLILSEHLYEDGFFSEMSDDEVRQMDDLLAQITEGMDLLSRTQYDTGIIFSHYRGSGTKYFRDKGELFGELEASTEALKYFSDKYISEEKKGEFNNLIEMYYAHNSKIIEEYSNPEEAMNKMIYAIRTGKYPNSAVLNERPPLKEAADYKYRVALGGIMQTKEQTKTYQENIGALFESLRKEQCSLDEVLMQWKLIYANYMTNDSEDDELKKYVLNRNETVLGRMQNYWERLINNLE